MTTEKQPATPLLEPVPYGATKFEVQREGIPAQRVATFDTLAEAKAYVHAFNAYPKLVEALRAMCGDGVHNERESLSMARALLHSLGEG